MFVDRPSGNEDEPFEGPNANAFGRAIYDHHAGDRSSPLVARDGEETRHHPIEKFYFEPVDPAADRTEWLESRLEGPLLDLGAGAGRDALYFQDQFETVALEVSGPLVETMDERGVENTRLGDMFAIGARFERNRFSSAIVIGTQAGLAGSIPGVRSLLGDLAAVTGPNATLVLDGYDPSEPACADLLGFRNDPRSGIATRAFWFEYETFVDPVLVFRLFGPDRLREATIGTPWELLDVRYGDSGYYYMAALEKG